MKQLTLILLLLSSIMLSAQSAAYLPFQGRLANNNGVALNGTYAFTFDILGSAYSENFFNVPVINGIYNVVLGTNVALPTNLFAAANSRQLKVSVNGSPLDTVAIYAALKGNIYWNEIQNKPSTLYLDSTYEQQELILTGSTLTITNGNSVNLPIQSQTNYFPNSLYVGSTDTISSTPISVPNNNTTYPSLYNNVWQSFVLTENASLDSIKLYFANTFNNSIQLNIYSGIGVLSLPTLHSEYFLCNNFNTGASQQIFALSSAVLLQKNVSYTFEITFLSGGGCGSTANGLVGINTANPYPGGYSSLGLGTDLIFELNINEVPDYSIAGTDTAVTFGAPVVRAKNGRYYDKTGLVQPVGAIIAFGGSTPPSGWLLCDGASYNHGQYPELYAVIDTFFGGSATNFNVPDLRGRFPRGVDGIAGNDPDANSRIAANPSTGGNTGNNVGSRQNDELKSHTHVIKYRRAHTVSGGDPYRLEPGFAQVTDGAITADNTGGSETRPKNVYVNYIIKY